MKFNFMTLLFCILLVSSFCIGRAFADNGNGAMGERCRGKYLRTDFKASNDENYLECKLVVRDGIPGIQVSSYIQRTMIGVKMYETLERIDSTDGRMYNGMSELSFISVPDVYTAGEIVEKTEKLSTEPCANETVKINGKQFVADEQGIVWDRPGEDNIGILEYFDQQDNLDMELLVSRPGYIDVNFKILRRMPQRREFDEGRLTESDEQELLYCYGLNFIPDDEIPERKALELEIILPEGELLPHHPYAIQVKVTNNGNVPTNCLAGRTFSRLPWLNNRWFYFGKIPPHQSMEFTRYVIADGLDKIKDAFFELQFRDTFGQLQLLRRESRLQLKK